MEKRVEALVDFTAQVLYIVMTKHVSHDRAFQEALRGPAGRASKHVPLRILYRVSRRVVSDYYLLRRAEEHVYGARGSARRMARLWLLLRADPELLGPLWDGVERLRRRMLRTMPRRLESVEELLDTISSPIERISVELSYPGWLVEKMVKLLGLEEAKRLLEWLNEEVWWIRVNTLKADVDTVARRLEEKGVVVRRDPDLPYMLQVVDYQTPLHHLEEMWKGEIVFQDKASAMVVEALEPEPGDTILDLAAAPGVKASLVMQLTGNRARLVLCDVSWERIARMKRLLRLYGVDMTRVEIVNTDSTTLDLRLKPTKVLVDAPCSSTGTIGRDPAVKVHLEDPSWATRFPPLQRQLLAKALLYEAPTVYATCSILPEEGEEVVETVNAAVEEPRIPGSPGYQGYRVASLVKRFFPHLHRTQGFFIARLRRGSG